MDADAKKQLTEQLESWRDRDEPLVEAIGNTLAESARVDSQDRARRVVDTIIEVFKREL